MSGRPGQSGGAKVHRRDEGGRDYRSEDDLRARWIVTNNGKAETSNVRARWIAHEFKFMDDLDSKHYARTPGLCIWEGQGLVTNAKNLVMDRADIRYWVALRVRKKQTWVKFKRVRRFLTRETDQMDTLLVEENKVQSDHIIRTPTATGRQIGRNARPQWRAGEILVGTTKRLLHYRRGTANSTLR